VKTSAITGLALSAALLVPQGGAARPLDLEPYRGRQRVLVLSAPTADDSRLAAMRRELREKACAAGERDLVVLEELGGAGFVVRLVGKDGGEKLRREAPVPVDEIFALIDTMPMRREELRRRPGAC
jgi:hypothetical protein